MFLQYKLELALAGMKDGPPGPLSPKQRLKMLREHQRAWAAFAWTAEESSSIERHAWELWGGILAQATSPTSIIFRQLPSKFRGVKEQQWIVDSEHRFTDFAIEVSTQILVLLETE